MNKEQIQALIDEKIAGQGSQVDIGGALPIILSEILKLASGEHVQSDWAENDNDSPAYIKHKPNASVILEVSNIEQLTNNQINMLRAGDIVVENDGANTESYIVEFKGDSSLWLVTADSREVVAAIYNLDGENWAFDSKETTAINAQSDWNQENSQSMSYIRNKPKIPDSPVQSDWAQSDEKELDYIKNKPEDLEHTTNKTTTVTSQSTDSEYPTAKAVFDAFQRKPVVIWETNDVGLVAINADISASPAWQLTNLDFSPFKRVKIYTKCSQKSGVTASASTTAAMVLEMTLDSRAAGPYGNHFVGSVLSQKPNDNNRLATLTCAISADKTSFVVLRMTNLYGTGITDNSDVGGYVFKIVGFYD